MLPLFKMIGDHVLAAFKDVRRSLGIVTEQEARLAYVDEARDRIDLERRIRELDRPQGSFTQYQVQGWRF